MKDAGIFPIKDFLKSLVISLCSVIRVDVLALQTMKSDLNIRG